MKWDLEWDTAAEEGMKHFPSWQDAARLCRAMMIFAETGEGDVRRVGQGPEYRLHAGSYVARFGIDASTETITVWTVFRKR
jgi:hypothetical protein